MRLSERLKHILGRPFIVLFREPMLLAITVYMSVRVSRTVIPVLRLTTPPSSYMA